MLRFGPKLGTERNSEWRCCFCLHVRTGTILLGSWHLMLHMIALCFLAAIVRDPKLMQELERDSVPMGDLADLSDVAALPTPLSNIEPPPSPYTQRAALDHSLVYHDVDVSALVTVCTLAITLMLIYGASRGKPAHLLPFFCLQIFDFAITVLTATGYLCYLRSIHRLVAETRHVPWRSQVLQLPAPALALLVMSAFMLAILAKGYCISVVWRCYKYLTMRAHALHNLTPFVISSSGAMTPAYAAPTPAPDYSSLLPNYDEAVKQSPPPTYHAATMMAAAQPPVAPPQAEAPAVAPEAPEVRSEAPNVPPTQPPQPATNTVVMLPQQGTQAPV